MKKSVLALCLSSLMGVCHAQKKFETGVKFGYVNSSLHFTESGTSSNFDAKHNIYLSLPVEYQVNSYFSLQGELGIAGLGGNNLPINGQNSPLHLATFYVPLGAKFYPFNQKFSFLGGVNLGFTLKALGEENGKKVEYTNFKTGNHSAFLGLEYKFTKNIFAETRYNLGLSNIANERGQTMKNNFFQVGIGYIFNNKTQQESTPKIPEEPVKQEITTEAPKETTS